MRGSMDLTAHITNMTPALVRAARAILKWSVAETADNSGVSRSTVFDYESGNSAERPRGINKANKNALARTFLDAGIEFTGGETPGLVIRRPELLD
jgi:transcriptional regulator with XRE-family HTH domain